MEPITIKGNENDFLEKVKDLFPKYSEYVIEGFTSDEGDFWTGHQSSTCGDSIFSNCVRFGAGNLLRDNEILSGLMYMMRHVDGLEKHWQLLKDENHTYYFYVSSDITKPAYFIDHKICFEDNKKDKEVIAKYIKSCKKKNTPVQIIQPMKGTSLYDCRFTQIGKSVNTECWWDGQRHRYLAGRPDNIDERLYTGIPRDDRRRYIRWV